MLVHKKKRKEEAILERMGEKYFERVDTFSFFFCVEV